MDRGSAELVLVVGDMHMPHRAADFPEKFKKILVPGRMQQVLCTGNLCTPEALSSLRAIAPTVHCVRGDFDEDDALPETKVVKVGEFKIGLCHGHQIVPWGDPEALAMMQRQLDVDILITGHTHKNSVMEYEGNYYINPGSITGAYSGMSSDVIPSFVLLSIDGPRVVTYVYELRGDEMPVTKSEFTKTVG